MSRDQAAVELERRDAWRKTLDQEIQLNTAHIDRMKQATKNGVGFSIATDLQLFIARRGWEIGYAATGHTINRWNSLREWIEDYPDNGGLHTTPSKVLPYVCQSEVKVTDAQREAAKQFFRELEPVDRLALRPQALKIAEVIGDQEIVDIVHDETKRSEGGDQRSDHACNSTDVVSSYVDPRTRLGARQQLRAYAADPKRCERYNKDHALCQEAWVKVEQGEMSVNEGRIYCGLQKKEPSRVFYATKDLEAFVARIKAVFPADACRTIAHLLTDSND